MQKSRKQIEVTVTAKDIAAGKRNVCGSCPVALAMGRVFPGATVEAGWHSLRTHRVGDMWRYANTPAKVMQWMMDFDQKGPEFVKPITFTMDEPR
jgi:hypothetical protein